MATKEHRRHARGLVESLESRIHSGPPVNDSEILTAQSFLRQNDFPASSEYYQRLGQLRRSLQARVGRPVVPQAKRNYGGKAGGSWVQVQSIYDHVILSTCYEGDFNFRRGRLKLSWRFNQAGRTDFVEAKLLQSFEPVLHGEIRKLIVLKDYQGVRTDWLLAEAFVLPVLPRELLLIDENIFRFDKPELYAGLINLGHQFAQQLVNEFPCANSSSQPDSSPNGERQLCLEALETDPIALPILRAAAGLEFSVELKGVNFVEVRCLRLFQTEGLANPIAACAC